MKRIHIESDFMSRNLKIFIIEDVQESGKIGLKKHDGSATIVDTASAKPPTPSFVIRDDEAELLLQALADRGLKTDNDHKIAGTLEATRGHLNDLQKIVFDHGLLRAKDITVEGDNTGTIHVEGFKS